MALIIQVFELTTLKQNNQDDDRNLSAWLYRLHKEKKPQIMNVAFVVMVSECATHKKTRMLVVLILELITHK